LERLKSFCVVIWESPWLALAWFRVRVSVSSAHRAHARRRVGVSSHGPEDAAIPAENLHGHCRHHDR
jgi:hypothetical protein